MTAMITGADRADAPRAQPPQRAAVEFVLLGQKAAQQAARWFRVRDRPARWSGFLAKASLALLRPAESRDKH